VREEWGGREGEGEGERDSGREGGRLAGCGWRVRGRLKKGR